MLFMFWPETHLRRSDDDEIVFLSSYMFLTLFFLILKRSVIFGLDREPQCQRKLPTKFSPHYPPIPVLPFCYQ